MQTTSQQTGFEQPGDPLGLGTQQALGEKPQKSVEQPWVARAAQPVSQLVWQQVGSMAQTTLQQVSSLQKGSPKGDGFVQGCEELPQLPQRRAQFWWASVAHSESQTTPQQKASMLQTSLQQSASLQKGVLDALQQSLPTEPQLAPPPQMSQNAAASPAQMSSHCVSQQ